MCTLDVICMGAADPHFMSLHGDCHHSSAGASLSSACSTSESLATRRMPLQQELSAAWSLCSRKRKDYTLRHHFHEKPSVIPGCPACAAELTKVVSCQAFPLGQVFLNHSLCGNTSVVCAGQPQHIIAAHAPPPHNSILNGVGEGMAQMQGACHVGGWDHNDEGWLVTV